MGELIQINLLAMSEIVRLSSPMFSTLKKI